MLLPKVKLKTVPTFPAAIHGGTGIDVTKTNGALTVSLDYDDFGVISALPTSPTSYVLTYDLATNAYIMVPSHLLGGSASGIADAPSDGVQYGRQNPGGGNTWTPIVGANPATDPLQIKMDGVAAVGTSTLYARQDHVHPSDTSRAAIASPDFTGIPTAQTAGVGTNTRQLATTAFVMSAVSGISSGGGSFLPLTGGNLSGSLSVTGSVAATSQIQGAQLVTKAITPDIGFVATSGAIDQKNWDILLSGTQMQFRAINDAFSAANVWLQANRGAGYTISSAVIPSPTQFGVGTLTPATMVDFEGPNAVYDTTVNANASPLLFQIAHGSVTNPVTSAAPTVGISRIEAISSDTEGSGNAALWVTCVANDNAGGGIAQASGVSAYVTQHGFGDACAFFGMAKNYNGRAYGGFFCGVAETAGCRAYGLEVDANNSTGGDLPYTGLTPYPEVVGIHVQSIGANIGTAGIWIGNIAAGYPFDVGIAMTPGSIKTYAFVSPGCLINAIGAVQTQGLNVHAGTAGAFGGSLYNINWNGTNVEIWIDGTKEFTVAGISDYRLKENVEAAPSALAEIRQWDLITFNRRKVGKYEHSAQRQWSWLAHDLQAISPDAVLGEKDELTDDGQIQPQSLNHTAIIARLARAVQELDQRLTKLGA